MKVLVSVICNMGLKLISYILGEVLDDIGKFFFCGKNDFMLWVYIELFFLVVWFC